MNKKDKELLLKDLCARLPYGFTIHRYSDNANIKINDIDEFAHFLEYSDGEEFKPYLRPMSSMTVDEWLELKEWIFVSSDTKGKIYFDGFRNISAEDTVKAIDYLISHYFDYRGLIEKGLALEAPEGMYKI